MSDLGRVVLNWQSQNQENRTLVNVNVSSGLMVIAAVLLVGIVAFIWTRPLLSAEDRGILLSAYDRISADSVAQRSSAVVDLKTFLGRPGVKDLSLFFKFKGLLRDKYRRVGDSSYEPYADYRAPEDLQNALTAIKAFRKGNPKLLLNDVESDLCFVNMSGTDLREVRLDGLTLDHVDFRNADLRDSILRSTDLTGALFDNASLDRADIECAWLYSKDIKPEQILSTRNWKFAWLPEGLSDPRLAVDEVERTKRCGE